MPTKQNFTNFLIEGKSADKFKRNGWTLSRFSTQYLEIV